MRDRANDLLAEEDDLARTLASTWARDADRKFPRLHTDTDRLLGSAQSMWTLSSTPEQPDAPMVQATGWGPVVGDGEGLAKRLGELLAEKYRVVVAADGVGSAGRMAELLRDRGLDFTIATSATDITKPGGTDRRCPAAPRLLVARGQARRACRGRPHRPARARIGSPAHATTAAPGSSRI